MSYQKDQHTGDHTGDDIIATFEYDYDAIIE
jgi:hypothetical protein